MKIILLSYTPIDSSGGVPRWNRDFMSGFLEAVHYSWWDVAQANNIDPNLQHIPEWDKAKILTQWLVKTGKIKDEDIVIGDNWWVDGLDHRERTISLSHGNWSHTTFEDVQKGIPPEFPLHAAKQLEFRKRYAKAGRKFVAVSDFIAYEMKRQWGFDAHVINNGIDLDKFKPRMSDSVGPDGIIKSTPWFDKTIVHFTTTENKGLQHINLIKNNLKFYSVLLLDDFAKLHPTIDKYELLSQADFVVHPSAHEGNSYAVLETLACNVPIVSYNVGLMWNYWIYNNKYDELVGGIIDRRYRSPEATLKDVEFMISEIENHRDEYEPRKWVSQFSIQNFHNNWREYLRKEFGYESKTTR